MTTLSEELALSKSTRSTVFERRDAELCNAFVPNQHVMRVTGHRNAYDSVCVCTYIFYMFHDYVILDQLSD